MDKCIFFCFTVLPSASLDWTQIASGVGSILSVCLAFAAFILSIGVKKDTWAHHKMMVAPMLQVISTYGPDKLKLEISNCGFGPARIRKFDVYVNGKLFNMIGTRQEVSGRVSRLFTHALPSLAYASVSDGAIINKDGCLVLLEFPDYKENQNSIDLGKVAMATFSSDFIKSISLVVLYECAYGEERALNHQAYLLEKANN